MGRILDPLGEYLNDHAWQTVVGAAMFGVLKRNRFVVPVLVIGLSLPMGGANATGSSPRTVSRTAPYDVGCWTTIDPNYYRQCGRSDEDARNGHVHAAPPTLVDCLVPRLDGDTCHEVTTMAGVYVHVAHRADWVRFSLRARFAGRRPHNTQAPEVCVQLDTARHHFVGEACRTVPLNRTVILVETLSQEPLSRGRYRLVGYIDDGTGRVDVLRFSCTTGNW